MILFEMALGSREVSEGDFVEMFVLSTKAYIYGQVILHTSFDAIVLMNDGSEHAPMKKSPITLGLSSKVVKRDFIDSDVVIFPDFKEGLSKDNNGIGLCITEVIASNKQSVPRGYVPSKDFYEDRKRKACEGIDSQGQIVNRVGGLSFL